MHGRVQHGQARVGLHLGARGVGQRLLGLAAPAQQQIPLGGIIGKPLARLEGGHGGIGRTHRGKGTVRLVLGHGELRIVVDAFAAGGVAIEHGVQHGRGHGGVAMVEADVDDIAILGGQHAQIAG